LNVSEALDYSVSSCEVLKLSSDYLAYITY